MLNLLRRLLRIEPSLTLGQWVYDRIANNWRWLVSLLGGGGIMSYLASITKWLSAWGPVVWGAIGIIFALLTLIGLSIASFFSSKARANEARALLEATQSKARDRINPLDRQFDKLVINLSDLFIPFRPVLMAKQFTDCLFMGPGVILFLERCEVLGPHATECTYVIFDEKKDPTNSAIHGVLGFRSSRFERCSFINITFLVPSIMATSIGNSQVPGSIPIKFIGYEPTRPPSSPSAAQSPSSSLAKT